MTADIRTAAQIEAGQLFRPQEMMFHDRTVVDLADPWRKAFVAGAVWAQARVTTTREQIAEELRKHKLIHVAVSRKSAFCACNPGVTAGVNDNLEWFEAHRADAILALLAELAEGESGEESGE